MVGRVDFSRLRCSVESLHARHEGRELDHDRAVRLVHVVNPVSVPSGHELERAQSVTYQCMREAVAFASRNDPALRIELVSTQFSEDRAAVPDDFHRLPDLTRDSASVRAFEVPRRLPLVDEIISRAHDYAQGSSSGGEETYLVLSNVDIGLLPHFYCYVAWLVRAGHDVSIINRRQIRDVYGSSEDLPKMMSDFGHRHPGLDCFAFDSKLVGEFVPHRALIGMPFVMRPLYFNLMAQARAPVMLLDAHATFHIGVASEWQSEKYNDYREFNRQECLRVIDALSESPEIERKLMDFVHATHEHRWLPEGVLGVVKPTDRQILQWKIRGRMRRLARALKELALCFKL